MVRHGATVLSAEDRFAGATDVALSDEGREQTRRLAERLSREKIMAVYVKAENPFDYRNSDHLKQAEAALINTIPNVAI